MRRRLRPFYMYIACVLRAQHLLHREGRQNAVTLACWHSSPQLNFHLNCRGDLVRTEIIEMDVCHPCPSR